MQNNKAGTFFPFNIQAFYDSKYNNSKSLQISRMHVLSLMDPYGVTE